jgi:hypothetical protein
MKKLSLFFALVLLNALGFGVIDLCARVHE